METKRLDIRNKQGILGQKFYSARVVDLPNGLGESTVSVDTIIVLKTKLVRISY